MNTCFGGKKDRSPLNLARGLSQEFEMVYEVKNGEKIKKGQLKAVLNAGFSDGNQKREAGASCGVWFEVD